MCKKKRNYLKKFLLNTYFRVVKYDKQCLVIKSEKY